jgi:DNA modification methylase
MAAHQFQPGEEQPLKAQKKVLAESGNRPKLAKESRKANHLDGKTWLRYSISIWDDIRKSQDEIKLNHPAMFPSDLPRRLIQMFTSENQKVVLDPFLGTGSTLIAAKELDKNGIGLDISREYIDLAAKRLNIKTGLFSHNVPQRLIHDDAKNILEYVEERSVDICITSPPYWDILTMKRTADNKGNKDYIEKQDNLGDIHDYQEFLEELKKIFKDVFFVLKPRSYCIVVVMDIRKKDVFYPFHTDIAKMMTEIGFIFDDMIIWNRKHEYSNLRPLGYPFVFRVNKIHEYILIFLKPGLKNK